MVTGPTGNSLQINSVRYAEQQTVFLSRSRDFIFIVFAL